MTRTLKAHAVNSGRGLGVAGRFPAALVRRLAPGLIVDAGAAVGSKTRMLLAASPASHVVAYEPFAGNLVHLRALAQADPRVAVRPVALADRAGQSRLHVASTTAQALEDRFPAGASVVGRLVADTGGDPAKLHPVETVRLDDEIAEPVRFLKMDIQGGEYAALQGARSLLAAGRIEYLYVEFNGDLRVLRLLDAHDYVLFDSLYLAWPGRFAPRNWFRPAAARTVPAWKPGAKVRLSTGAVARHVWPPVPFRSLIGYCAWFAFMRVFVCGLQTDLLCVHRSQLDRFARISLEAGLERRARHAGKAAADSPD